MPPYQPERGHFIWIDCDPQAGTEQAGRRPALVLSPLFFNVGTGLIVACPVTNQAKGSRLEVPLPPGMTVTGVVLAYQVKTFDWMRRNAAFIGVASAQLVNEVVARVAAIIEAD